MNQTPPSADAGDSAPARPPLTPQPVPRISPPPAYRAPAGAGPAAGPVIVSDAAAAALAREQSRDPWFGERADPCSRAGHGSAEVMALAWARVLGVPGERVRARADPTRAGLDPLDYLLEVEDNIVDPLGAPDVIGFAPIPILAGLEHGSAGSRPMALYLLGLCAQCQARDAALAVVTSLADLGFYARYRRGPVHAEQHLLAHDPGHNPWCVWRARRAVPWRA